MPSNVSQREIPIWSRGRKAMAQRTPESGGQSVVTESALSSPASSLSDALGLDDPGVAARGRANFVSHLKCIDR